MLASRARGERREARAEKKKKKKKKNGAPATGLPLLCPRYARIARDKIGTYFGSHGGLLEGWSVRGWS